MVMMPRFCWFVPLPHLSLPRLFLSIDSPLQAISNDAFFLEQATEAPLTSDKLAAKFGLPD